MADPTYCLFDVAIFDPTSGKILYEGRITAVSETSARNKAVARLAGSDLGDDDLEDVLDRVRITVRPFS